jgi:hypothetical protein
MQPSAFSHRLKGKSKRATADFHGWHGSDFFRQKLIHEDPCESVVKVLLGVVVTVLHEQFRIGLHQPMQLIGPERLQRIHLQGILTQATLREFSVRTEGPPTYAVLGLNNSNDKKSVKGVLLANHVKKSKDYFAKIG